MKKNIPLLAGLAIPILMILFVAGSIYLPELFISSPSPQFNFLYSTGGDYYRWKQYFVKDGRLDKQEVPYPKGDIPRYPENPTLFIYDMQKQENKRVDFDEASKLNLNPNQLSPDGFKIDCARRREWGVVDIFLGIDGYSDCRTVYIIGHHSGKKIGTATASNEYSNRFIFLGWIMEPQP